MKKTNAKKGFTLMELLIVVAIIAVLIAIAIPVLNGQLEKAREAADAANIRSAYAEVMVQSLEAETGEDEDDIESDDITLTQKQDGWQTADVADSLAKLGTVEGTPSAGGTAKVAYTPGDSDDVEGSVTITFEDGE